MGRHTAPAPGAPRLAEVLCNAVRPAADTRHDESSAASPACGVQVLVEGPARRTPGLLTGRTCHNKRVVFPADGAVPASLAAAAAVSLACDLGAGSGSRAGPGPQGAPGSAGAPLKAGDYVAVEVLRAGVQSLGAAPLARTTAAEFVARFVSTLPGAAARDGLRAAQRALAAQAAACSRD